jgi:UDP-3-O-[3-hydroxymyristoyl] glucosamine N-acyltransferase
MQINVSASDIAAFLKAKIFGENIQINSVKSMDDIAENALAFSKAKLANDFLKNTKHTCFITSELPENIGSNTFIIVENPRLAFAKVLSAFFVEKKTPGIGEYTVIHPSSVIGKSVIIGNCCTIGRDVVIGDSTEIRNNVVITEGVKIGRHCLIRSGAVIGEEGFGFDYEENGIPVRIPHLGSVEIGDFVEVGNFTAIARGTLKNTIIHSHVKIDNLVHIAHNCIIGEKTMIIACAEVSGSSVVGENCWLGVGCSTMQKIKVGHNCLIGIGSIVLKDVPSGSVMAGNPAKLIRMQGEVK